MLCDLCTNNTLHLLSDDELEQHIQNCPWCAEHKEWDLKLLQQAAKLEPIKTTDELWGKIEGALLSQKKSDIKITRQWGYKIWLIAASLFLAIISSSLVLIFQATNTSENILSAAAIIKVEINEHSYVKSIEELEKTADSRLSDFDTDLMLLYKDKLATIDSQILKCRREIEKNPGNGHIRRYMLSALQDKKETLKEIINLNTGS